MKQIPFVAFAPAEKEALLAVLRQAGLRPREVCASRLVWDGTVSLQGARCVATVTAPGFCGTYAADGSSGWIAALRGELSAVTAARGPGA